jgi:LmbE family N-acetylglucosaminyl deacetylase
MKNLVLLFLLCFLVGGFSYSQEGPKVLIVTAHPDDDAACAATVYKITHDMHGKVDIALITNGEGGYKYSTLAEDVYGLELTDEKIGRESLPTIREKELMAGGKIVGVRNYYFFDQKDTKYTLDMTEVLTSAWDTAAVKQRLKKIILQGKYNYIFCLLPVPETHGHHKSATLLALLSTVELPEGQRPVVFAVSTSEKNDTTKVVFSGLKEYPITAVNTASPVFFFDRTQPFGYKNVLNYKILVNWLIAEHKSQGTMQLLMNRGDYENFYSFNINSPEKVEEAKKVFQALSINHFKSKSYGE